MKKKLLLLVAALLAIGQNAFAYDFSAVAPSGQTLYYKIIDSVNHYVKVTYPNDDQVDASVFSPWGEPFSLCWGNYSRPIGILVIPESLSYNDVNYTVRTIGYGAFCDCPHLTQVVMPNTVDSIGKCAFFNCNILSNVTFSNTLQYIGEFAFMGCHLGDVVLPSSVKVLKEKSMVSANITSITLSDSLQIMTTDCLTDNPFTSLYIPASVSSIQSIPWGGLGDRRTSIVVDPNNPYFDSRDNCNAIIRTHDNVLIVGCQNTTIPNNVSVSGEAFAQCSLDTLLVPSSIHQFTFYWAHINKLIISSPAFTIDWNSMGDVDTIQILNEIPPIHVIGNPDQCNYAKPIIVPCNTLTAYQSSEWWSNFTNMREPATPQITVNAEHGTAIVETYPSCGNDTVTVSATTDEEHYHFVSWSDGSTQNPYTLVLNGNTTLSAIFAIDSVLVRATSANPLKGAVMGGGVVPLNGTTTLTAIPSGSSIFLTWSNGVTDNPYTLTATSDTSLQAYFTLPDTLIFRDTINHYIHDTTFINNYVHDTTIQYVNQYIHDTTYINNYVHDTTILYMNQYVHDTTYINNYIHDTVRMTTQMFDTTIVNVYHFDTAIYNTYHFDTLIVKNHYYDTVYITTHHYDTIYITEQGIGDVDGINAKVYSSNGQVVVEGANGNMVTLYDVTGRVLAAKQDDYAPMRFDAPATGTYMIKIGAYPARKVVGIR